MSYRIALRCASPDWWRYNLFLTLVGYDARGEREDYVARAEHLFDVWGDPEGRTPPADWQPEQEIALECRATGHAAVWVYAIPHTLPDQGSVAASPDLEVELIASRDGRELFRKSYSVNPWGGLSIVELGLN